MEMFKRMPTNLDTQPITMQQGLMCALKNARLPPDGYLCLNDTGNKIPFRINWWHVNQGINVAP